MQTSIVNYIKVESHSELRLEAEYYKPEFINLEILLNGLDTKPFGKLVQEIKCGPFGSSILCDTYYEDGVIVARPFNINNCILENTNLAFIAEKDCKDKSLKIYSEGDIFFSRVGDIRCGVIPKFDNKITISPNIIAVKTDTRKLNPYYATIFFNTKYGFGQIFRNIKVVAQPTIPTEIIKDLKIVMLKDTFQKTIETIFKKYFKLNEKAEFLYSKAEGLLLDELGLSDWQPKHQLSFVGSFLDVQNTNRIDAEYFQPKYEEIIIKIKNYSNGYGKLDKIFTMKKGVEVGSDAYDEGGIPFVRVSNLNKFGINDNNQQYISEDDYKELKDKFQPQKNEILLSKDGTPGIAYHINNEPTKMIPSGGILRLIVKNNDYLPEYVTLVLNSIIVQEQIEQVSSGALIKHWIVDSINKTVIPKLPMKKQKEIVLKLQNSFKCREQSKQLLEIAKSGVEKAIEENEKISTNWINKQLAQIGISL